MPNIHRVAPRVALVVALLSVAAAGADAGPQAWRLGPARHASGAVPLLADAAAVGLGLVTAALVAALALTVRNRRRRGETPPDRVPERPPGQWRDRASVVAVAVAAVATPFLAVWLVGRAPPGPAPTAAPLSPTGAAATPGSTPVAGAEGHAGTLVTEVAGVTALALLAAAGWWARRRRPRPTPTPSHAGVGDTLGEVMAEATRAGTAALSGDDPRTAVLRCYAAMARTLREAGVAGRASDVPGELLQRAATARAVPAGPAQRLTDLFGEARFSSHPFGQAQREAAAEALAQIRAGVSR